MTEPTVAIGRDRRTEDGRLLPEDATRIAEVLNAGGFVLLPSDTAYSVATHILDVSVRDRINRLLERGNVAISQAFSSVRRAEQWIMPNPVVSALLERYCPGPLTVVCAQSPHGMPITQDALASENETLGVRVPNSVIERHVADLTEYPITTVAVRVPNPDGTPGVLVTALEPALDVIRPGLAAAGFPAWATIDDEIRYEQHSTVVEVSRDGRQLIHHRSGGVPFDEILAFHRELMVS